MTDSRFYDRAGPFTLGEIAGRIGAELAKGDPADLKLTDVAALEGAEGGDISLFSDAKYANAFAVTKASVVITSDKLAGLPHVGRKTAESIVAFREQNGPFRRVEHLMLVRGISEAHFADLRSMVRVE